jgi:hypothetical protein
MLYLHGHLVNGRTYSFGLPAATHVGSWLADVPGISTALLDKLSTVVWSWS